MCAFRNGDSLDDGSTERRSGWVEAAVGLRDWLCGVTVGDSDCSMG